MNRKRSTLLFSALLPGVLVFACGAKQPESQTADSANGTVPPSPPEGAKPQSDGPPRDHARRAPPEEAFTACTGKTEGAECNVKRGEETVAGTCRKGPPDSSDTRLACMPQGGPGKPGEGPSDRR